MVYVNGSDVIRLIEAVDRPNFRLFGHGQLLVYR